MSKDFYIMIRGWMDDDVFEDEPYTEREAFLYMIEKAAWKDRPFRVAGKIMKLKRGQLTASLRYLAQAWRWDKNRVSRFLAIMVDADRVELENGTGQNVITICNYCKYQDVNRESGTDVGQQQGQRRDRGGTEAGQRRDKTNQYNQYNQLITRENVFLEKCLKTAEINLMRNPNQKITEQCEEFAEKWETQGMIFEDHIEPVIRETVNRCQAIGKPVPATLKYYAKPINEKFSKARSEENQDGELIKWRNRVRYWKKSNQWDHNNHGPLPNRPDTRVPVAVLDEFEVTSGYSQ